MPTDDEIKKNIAPIKKGDTNFFETVTYDTSRIHYTDDEKVSNINVGDYSPYLPQGVFFSEALDRSRAMAQSGSEQAWRAIKTLPQAIGATIIGDVASMIDIEDYSNSDSEVGNAVKRWSMDYVEGLHEDNPIYRVNPGESFDFSDSAYWYENGRNLAESAGAFLVEGYLTGGAAASLFGGALKGAKFAKAIAAGKSMDKASRFARAVSAGEAGVLQGMSGLASSVILNQTESIGSAIGVYDETYKAMINNGMTEDVAKKRAADAAAYTVSINRVNILLNLTSASAFIKPISTANNLLKKMDWKSTLGLLGKEGIQETVEEMINYTSEQAGMARGKGEDLTLRDMFGEAFSEEGREAGMLGAIGGIVQTGGQEITGAISSNKFKRGIYDDKTRNYLSRRADNNRRFTEQERLLADDIKLFSEIGAVPKLSSVFRHGQELIDYSKKVDALRVEAAALKSEGKLAEYDKKVLEINEEKSKHIAYSAYEHFEAGASQYLKDTFTRVINGEAPQGAETNPNSPDYYKTRATEALDLINQLEKEYNYAKAYNNYADIYSNRANKIIKEKELFKKNNELTELRVKAENRVNEEKSLGNLNTVVEHFPEGEKKEVDIDFENLEKDLNYKFKGQKYEPSEEEKEIFKINNSVVKLKLSSFKEVKNYFNSLQEKRALEKSIQLLNKEFDDITDEKTQEEIFKDKAKRIAAANKKAEAMNDIREIEDLIALGKSTDEDAEIINALINRKNKLKQNAEIKEAEDKAKLKKVEEVEELTSFGEVALEDTLADEDTDSADKVKVVEIVTIDNETIKKQDSTIYQGEDTDYDKIEKEERDKATKNNSIGVMYGDPADANYNKSGQVADKNHTGLSEYLHDFRINKVGQKLEFVSEREIVGVDISSIETDDYPIRMYVVNNDRKRITHNGKEVYGWYAKATTKKGTNLNQLENRKTLLNYLSKGNRITTEITKVGDGRKHPDPNTFVSPTEIFGKGTIFVEDGEGLIVRKARNGVRQLGEIGGKTVFATWFASTKGRVRFANDKTRTPDGEVYPIQMEVKKLGNSGSRVVSGVLAAISQNTKYDSKDAIKKDKLSWVGISGLTLRQAMELYFFKSRFGEKNTIEWEWEKNNLYVSYWKKNGKNSVRVREAFAKVQGEIDFIQSLETSYRSVNIEMTGLTLGESIGVENEFTITDEKGVRTYGPDTIYDDFLFQEGVLTTNLVTYNVNPGLTSLAAKPYLDFKENPNDWSIDKKKEEIKDFPLEEPTEKDFKGLSEEADLFADEELLRKIPTDDGDVVSEEEIDLEGETMETTGKSSKKNPKQKEQINTISNLKIEDESLATLPSKEKELTKEDLINSFKEGLYSDIFDNFGVYSAKDISAMKESTLAEINKEICNL
jgi:hypothetical protein